MTDDAYTCDVRDWFQTALGLNEEEWLALAATSPSSVLRVDDGNALGFPISLLAKDGSALPAGSFSVWSIDDLQAAAREDTEPQTYPIPSIDIYVRGSATVSTDSVDVHVLQSAPKYAKKTMFQVASNFNCLEAANERVDYASGTFVTNLMSDSTQGPAASSACALSAIVRAHLTFVDPVTHAASGQRHKGRQVELLGHKSLAPYFPVLNGKLYTGRVTARDPSSEVLPSHLNVGAARIGLHCDAVPMFRRVGKRQCTINKATRARVDQVFVAGMDLRAVGVRGLSKEAVTSRMHFLLEAAYSGTYGACSLRKSEILVLTLVGGGVFANPWGAIGTAIGAAHIRWVKSGLCPRLKAVHLPIFALDEAELKSLTQNIRAQGVRVKVVGIIE